MSKPAHVWPPRNGTGLPSRASRLPPFGPQNSAASFAVVATPVTLLGKNSRPLRGLTRGHIQSSTSASPGQPGAGSPLRTATARSAALRPIR